MTTNIPKSVIREDHRLDTVAGNASENLARHRWHNTLDPDGPQYGYAAYARAVGRNEKTIARYAKGYALFVERASDPGFKSGSLTVQDALELARQTADQQAFTEAIAEGSGEPIQRVGNPQRRHERAAIIGQAQDRAERRGTDPVDEARAIAEQKRKSREMDQRRRDERAKSHTMRYIEVESKLVTAKRALLAAINAAAGVDFDDEELDLMRHSLRDVQAVLTLLDARFAGTVDVDWDAELLRLGGAS